jgi:preprotein translocase subunit YajC
MAYPTFLLLQATGGNPLIGFLPLLLIVGIFYFLVFMPMQKQRKQQALLLKNLQNGSMVITTGGLVGTIISINPDDTLIIRVKPDNVKLQVSRASVTGLVTEETKKA